MELDIREELAYFRKKQDGIYAPHLSAQVSELGSWLETMQSISDQLNKQMRFAFKINQESQSKFDLLLQETKELSAWQRDQVQWQQKLDEWEWRLIGVIDQLDHAASFLQEQEDREWYPFFAKLITQLLQELQILRIQEIDVIDKSFDPFTCEALDTMKRVEGEQLVPYQVGKVVKRGFQKNGVILRKAQVLTIEEEERKDGE
jgi:hypothetical protein